MLTFRQRIVLFAGIPLLIIIAALVWWFVRGRQPHASPSVNPTSTPVETELNTEVEYRKPDVTSTPEQIQDSPDEIYVKQVSRIFVERFSSYSNQNNNQHIDDALSMATPRMQEWVTSQRKIQSEQYEGVTTEVLSSRIFSYAADSATVEIGAKQTTRKAGVPGSQMVEETKIIKAKVDLVKEGGTWLVNGLWVE